MTDNSFSTNSYLFHSKSLSTPVPTCHIPLTVRILINPGKKDVAMIHQISAHHPKTTKKTKSSYYFTD